jgi:hypothetical protein
MKKYLTQSLLIAFIVILSGMNPLLAEPKEEAKDLSPVAELPQTKSLEGAISILSADASTFKLMTTDGNTFGISLKDAKIMKDGQEIDKSSLQAGQAVRVYLVNQDDIQVAKTVEILPPANK